MPETRARRALVTNEEQVHGLFLPPTSSSPQPLRVQLRGQNSAPLEIRHPYRLRCIAEPTVQPLAVDTALFAVAVDAQGTVWAGGSGTRPGTFGTLVQVAATGQIIQQRDLAPENAPLPPEAQGRLHLLFFARTEEGIVANGDVVLDPQFPTRLCQTVNAFDAAYPLLMQTPESQTLRPSPNTRVTAAGGADVWLYGSDGGAARVADTLRNGQCPDEVQVDYAPVYRRDTSDLLSNTVPALVVSADETLWLGTALGLQRVQGDPWTTVPFAPDRPVQGDPATLEMFFQPVAQALLAAQPLTTVGPNGAFSAQFGEPLRKEEVVFSLVEDGRGRLWVGTLGGGLRRIDGDQQTLHLTHREGLPSNLIVALAAGPDGVLWVATEAGVTRLEEDEETGTLTLTTLTALDGLALPVRDIAIDAAGTAWVATEHGLFRLARQRGQIVGVVQDPLGQPVVGVDVLVQGTPLRAVTDAAGRFVVAHLPPGEYVLVFDGRLAAGGPFSPTQQDVTVARGVQTIDPVQVAQIPRLLAHAGQGAAVTVDTPLSLVVLATDRFGTPLDGVSVTFRITQGNGSLALAEVTTGTDGQAMITLTAGTQAGVNQVQASTAGIDPVVLTVTGLADRGTARLRLVAGNDQVGFPQQVLRAPLVVRLEDRFANPLPGEAITAQLIEGAGAFVDPPQERRPPRGRADVLARTSGGATRTELTDTAGTVRFSLRVDTLAGVADVRTFAPALPQAGEQQFRVDIARIAVGDSPVAIAVADVDGDGQLDVLTANGDSGDISVLRGRGDGTFAAPQRFGIGRFPTALAAADVNGDGHLDVLTANGDSNDVSVLRGRGDGSFGVFGGVF